MNPRRRRSAIDHAARASIAAESSKQEIARNQRRRERRQAQRGLNLSTECECGNPKPPAAVACSRCVGLDGQTSCEAEVIHLLRTTGPRTLRAIADETKRPDRAVHQTLTHLQSRGRLAKIRDTDAETGKAFLYTLAEIR